jgi:hypothetical protein
VGVAACLSSFEWLAVRRELAPTGCFAWKLAGSRPFLLRHAGAGRALAVVFEPPGVVVVLALRAVSALLLIAAAAAGLDLGPPLAALALTSVVLISRDPYSVDGSDQMIVVVAGGLAVGKLFGAESAAVVFVAAQAAAAYFIAGMAKLQGRDWRVGNAVPLILSTRGYGAPSLGVLLWERRWIGRAFTWTTMSFEFLFPLALVAPSQVLLGFLVAGVLFHAGAAVAMGLNVFLWAFVATYPCVIYLSQQV